MTLNNPSNTPEISHLNRERILEGCPGTTYTMVNPSSKW